MSISTIFRRLSRTVPAALLLLPGLASAQIVRGTIRENGGPPVGGAVVTLLANGKRVASALSSETGSYSVRASAAGTYTLEVKRIGVRALTVGPFELGASEARTEDVNVRPIPMLQPEVRVAGKNKCVLRPDATEATATVWENTRAALQAVRLTEQDRLVHASVTRFTRELDAQTFKVLKEERRESFTYGEHPFVSAPAEELAKLGYVRRDGSDFVYFAPDASVILSDVFLDGHCFRLVNGTGADASNVGLAFEPVTGKDLAEISGTLWVDRQTSELRSIVFLYENPPPPHERGQAGGTLHFRRIATGAWIVDRWTMRWPRFAGVTRQSNASMAVVIGNRTAAAPQGFREIGGEATIVGAADVGFGVLRGTVRDGDLGRPVANARIIVSRGGFVERRLTSDGRGLFAADTLPPGTYNIAVGQARLDSLGVAAQGRALTLHARDSVAVDLALPGDVAVWKALCSGSSPGADIAIVRVLVTEGRNGEPRSGASVRASWGGGSAGAVTGTTDEGGAWTFCSVPVGRKVRLSLTGPDRELAGRDLSLAPGAIVVVPLVAPMIR
jgi:hypothetical protein